MKRKLKSLHRILIRIPTTYLIYLYYKLRDKKNKTHYSREQAWAWLALNHARNNKRGMVYVDTMMDGKR